MAINSRSKGAKNERKLADLLTEWTNKKFARTPASGGLQWKSSFSKGDLVCTVEGHYFPFCIEAKFHKKIDFSHLLTPGIKNIDIMDFWKQCKRDAKACKKVPILFMRYNGLPKDFHYVIIEKRFMKELWTLFATRVSPLLGMELLGRSLIIIKSTDFFKLPYKEIKLLAKTYIKNDPTNK